MAMILCEHRYCWVFNLHSNHEAIISSSVDAFINENWQGKYSGDTVHYWNRKCANFNPINSPADNSSSKKHIHRERNRGGRYWPHIPDRKDLRYKRRCCAYPWEHSENFNSLHFRPFISMISKFRQSFDRVQGKKEACKYLSKWINESIRSQISS